MTHSLTPRSTRRHGWGLFLAVAFSGACFADRARAQAPIPTSPVPDAAPTGTAAPAPTLTAPPVPEPAAAPPPEKPAHFFDRISVRGYTQFRYNQLGATNERLVNLQGDRSVGQDAGILIRRARLVLSGDLHPQVQMYLQPDFAGSVGDSLHIAQLRDWYFDLALDEQKMFRFRVGQSKVPFGFENMQSSQNRLPMDRSDALNSALAGERDLGVFFYYAPPEIRKRFKHLIESGLKGSGDYGLVALGVYEGQTINQADANTNKHVVGRMTYPFLFGEQIIELGVSGYTGKFVVRTDAGVTAPDDVRDARGALSLTVYPQPIGLQAEYSLGVGPELTNAATVSDDAGEETFTGQVQRKKLHGGYALVSLKLDDLVPGTLIPYARVMNYEGGKKHERNAPRYSVRELEAGVEWQILRQVEATAAYAVARRTDGRAPYGIESGSLIRLQLQINY